MFLILVFLLEFILVCQSHICGHSTLKKEKIRKIPGFSPNTFPFGEKKVTENVYENIRIYADYSSLMDGTTQQKEYIRNQLVPSAMSFFQSTLKVKRFPVRMVIPYTCGDLQPSSMLRTTGVEADLVILVTAGYYVESFVAAAMACATDSITNRPVYGVVYFNLAYMEINSETALEENLSTTLHEFTHVLGFASDLYPYYINPKTGIPLNNHLGVKRVNDKWVNYLSVEPLTSKLRSYFGCSTLEGAYMEDAGSEGSAGSHFERRIFMNEFMTASTVTDPVVSEFTLALLEGTGWYQVDYSIAEPFFWGKDEGCKFLDGPCVDKKGQPNFDEFCSPLTRIGCSYSQRSIAVCGTVGSIATDPALPISEDYWGNQTTVLDPFTDNCPYFIGFASADCENELNRNVFLKQEKHGHTSRCFEGTLNAVSSQYNRHVGFCFKTECEKQENGNFFVKIEVGSTNITCTQEKKVSVPNLFGYLECPDPDDFCEKANPRYCERGCSGRGECVDGQCQCPDGWEGSDCGLRKYVNNCERCRSNVKNTACFGDECLCYPENSDCPNPNLVGSGGTLTGSENPQQDGNSEQAKENKKLSIVIWLIVCVIVLFWRTKLVRRQ